MGSGERRWAQSGVLHPETAGELQSGNGEIEDTTVAMGGGDREEVQEPGGPGVGRAISEHLKSPQIKRDRESGAKLAKSQRDDCFIFPSAGSLGSGGRGCRQGGRNCFLL